MQVLSDENKRLERQQTTMKAEVVFLREECGRQRSENEHQTEEITRLVQECKRQADVIHQLQEDLQLRSQQKTRHQSLPSSSSSPYVRIILCHISFSTTACACIILFSCHHAVHYYAAYESSPEEPSKARVRQDILDARYGHSAQRCKTSRNNWKTVPQSSWCYR